MRDATLGRQNQTITAALMQSASTLGFRVIAEGIETEEQLVLLRSLGCHYGQGFLLGRPAPAEDIEDLLRIEGTALGHS